MNVRTIVPFRLTGRNRPVHLARLVHDVGSFRHVRFRRLFNHDYGRCNTEATLKEAQLQQRTG
jgi:hypothetical protein